MSNNKNLIGFQAGGCITNFHVTKENGYWFPKHIYQSNANFNLALAQSVSSVLIPRKHLFVESQQQKH